MENFNDSKALAIEIAKILDKKKAHDVRVLKVESLTVLTDYFVIASGTSTTRTPAGSSAGGAVPSATASSSGGGPQRRASPTSLVPSQRNTPWARRVFFSAPSLRRRVISGFCRLVMRSMAVLLTSPGDG